MGLTPAQVTEIDLAAQRVRDARSLCREVDEAQVNLDAARKGADEKLNNAEAGFYETIARVTGISDPALPLLQRRSAQ